MALSGGSEVLQVNLQTSVVQTLISSAPATVNAMLFYNNTLFLGSVTGGTGRVGVIVQLLCPMLVLLMLRTRNFNQAWELYWEWLQKDLIFTGVNTRRV